ncbi:hypothetical protein SODALDRAFT_379276 [Sodiomyces alkalinus F11]|uniref:LDB19 N-terminal domain-containing protein n=1 Tax=Sodiomyces alkalinus (strain CBS 110278 / VKM F-3762 / F11) TaxID=1314773 RepID=A0A3N2PU73_SODAK|nr:hypothetical protein SODALDRAFT_379276 [Sodiomyces alkalinus F11]ROT38050.1 hypothetical protein SODALDRAFT_379276 [Sodiomyces alkalinus F11]
MACPLRIEAFINAVNAPGGTKNRTDRTHHHSQCKQSQPDILARAVVNIGDENPNHEELPFFETLQLFGLSSIETKIDKQTDQLTTRCGVQRHWTFKVNNRRICPVHPSSPQTSRGTTGKERIKAKGRERQALRLGLGETERLGQTILQFTVTSFASDKQANKARRTGRCNPGTATSQHVTPVADFLRSSTETLSAAAKSSLKSSIHPRSESDSSSQRRDSSHSRSPTRSRIDRQFCRTPSVSDDGSDHFVPFIQMYAPEPVPANIRSERRRRRGSRERGDVKDSKEKVKQQHDSSHARRLSMPFGRSKERRENPHASLSWEVESPPIIFYGEAEASTGALVSGQLFLDIKDEALDVDSFIATLLIHVHHKRPFSSHCADCTDQYTELKRWVFLHTRDGVPSALRRGRHAFPFSVLLDGHLPTTMETSLLSISYEFRAEAVFASHPDASPALKPSRLSFDRIFEVKRSLLRPDTPHQSVRIFPPTNIKAAASYIRIIHPAVSGQNLALRLDGLATANPEAKRVEYWKLKKVTWKLQETIKTVAPACKKHMPHIPGGGAAAAAVDGTSTSTSADEAAQRKGVLRTETRTLGEKHLHGGWKSEYTSTEGRVDLEFEFGLSPAMLGSSRPGYACDAGSRDGTSVTHALVVEMVVSKEWAPVGKPQLASQTGTGRILRMHYNIMLTDFPGLGISWDNEAPPVYQDVPPSPPAYQPDDGAPGADYRDLEPLDAVRGSPELAVRDWRWEESDLQSP